MDTHTYTHTHTKRETEDVVKEQEQEQEQEQEKEQEKEKEIKEEQDWEDEDEEDLGPDLWGPPLWLAFHTAAEFSDRLAALDIWPQLLLAMVSSDGIPCPECSGHFCEWYTTHPYQIQATLTDVLTYTRLWFLHLHNNVNLRAEPPTPVWTVDQVCSTYGGEDRAAKVDAALACLTVLDGLVGSEVLVQLRALLQAVRE